MDPLFGSVVRARVLEYLALTPIPQTAYRIAKGTGAEPIQVLRVLKALGDLTVRTPAGWVLRDELLREFLRERWRREAQARRLEKDELLEQFGLRPSLEYAHPRAR